MSWSASESDVMRSNQRKTQVEQIVRLFCFATIYKSSLLAESTIDSTDVHAIKTSLLHKCLASAQLLKKKNLWLLWLFFFFDLVIPLLPRSKTCPYTRQNIKMSCTILAQTGLTCVFFLLIYFAGFCSCLCVRLFAYFIPGHRCNALNWTMCYEINMIAGLLLLFVFLLPLPSTIIVAGQTIQFVYVYNLKWTYCVCAPSTVCERSNMHWEGAFSWSL